MCKDGFKKKSTTAAAAALDETTPHDTSSDANLKILLCSENVPPQVNGIARRIGHYAEGLEELKCHVTLIHPESPECWRHLNPWNFTARMMILLPPSFWKLQATEFDVVHAVMPLNLSGMWLLAGYKLQRLLVGGAVKGPALVVSWHCNLLDYNEHHFPAICRKPCKWMLMSIVGILGHVSDRIVTPTRVTEPEITSLYPPSQRGVCYTGIELDQFDPRLKHVSTWGHVWQKRKEELLAESGKKYLIVCVSRLSVEKGIDELLQCLTLLPDCALWLVGDGPARPELELLATQLESPVKFWGYQKGEALSTAYTAADLFLCPSLTETFGQTVNEALALEVRVALPKVEVFQEAYGHVVPHDAFWTPLDRQDMRRAIQLQLHRHSVQDETGMPDRTKLRTWSQASFELLQEYKLAIRTASQEKPDTTMSIWILLYLPIWWACTVFIAIYLFVLSLLRTLVGGSSVRHFCRMLPRRVKHKVKAQVSKAKTKVRKLRKRKTRVGSNTKRFKIVAAQQQQQDLFYDSVSDTDKCTTSDEEWEQTKQD